MMRLTDEQRTWLKQRIQQLSSRRKSVGPFRVAGITRTIHGMEKQLKDGVWKPYGGQK